MIYTREIERQSHEALSGGEGVLYAALRALEREGMVESQIGLANAAPGEISHDSSLSALHEEEHSEAVYEHLSRKVENLTKLAQEDKLCWVV